MQGGNFLEKISAHLLMNVLFTIQQRKNELRHFGEKIGNCWYFSLEELFYLKNNNIILEHPLFNTKYFTRMIKSKRFLKKYTAYEFLKKNGFNIIRNCVYLHTKNFNHKKDHDFGILKYVSKDMSSELTESVLVICSEKEFYIIHLRPCTLNMTLTRKLIKNSSL